MKNTHIILFVGWLLILTACRSSLPTSENSILSPLNVADLENVYQYSERVYGGSGPYTKADFAELKHLGIGAVISVDGATPKVELAEAEGLRYVHIPLGYNGVPREAQLQLAKAYRETSGRIYVHCHHGKHRGPAAVASMLAGVGIMTPEEGVMALQQAGTSEEYRRLYRDVENACVLSVDEIAEAAALVSVAVVSDFIQTMAAIDVHWDHLKLIRKAGWSATEEHPDIDPTHEALLLSEQFRELLRQDKETEYAEAELLELKDFRDNLKSAVEQSAELESGLRQGAAIEDLETRYQALKQSCMSCHEAYRN